MSQPFLSVIVPALNEEGCIAAFIERMRAELSALAGSWEIVVVDDGSTDRTRAIVEAEASADPRIRLMTGPHRGKGAAVQQGMLAATGTWRFMADADLAMPPDNLSRFLALTRAGNPPDFIIGSREAQGSQRIGESRTRHVIGRLFNWVVRIVALPRITDTQCGFKLCRAAAVEAIFPRLTTPGFAFDVEMLFLARREGFDIRDVGIVWKGRPDSRVELGRGAAAFLDIVRIRWRWRNPWRAWAYATAMIFAASISFNLWRMPIQVSDSLVEILDAQRSTSVVESFTGSFKGAVAYLRPLRIAQIKALFDLSQGHYHLAYRGFHVLLLVSLLLLFTRALRVKSSRELAAAVFALTVLTGLHTFLAFLREAFPINHFLEIAVLSLAALNLAQSEGGWLVDLAACLVFAIAALTLEAGLLVWVVIAAAWMSGFRGVSTRGVVLATTLLVGYFVLRFGYLDAGTPTLVERSSGFLLGRLEPEELQRRFGAGPLPFYVYNVTTSCLSVLFAEPREGVFVAVRDWLAGGVFPRTYLAVASSVATSALIVVWAIARWRRRDGLTSSDRVAFVAGAVLLANSAISFAYTKDEIVAVAGVFYALAAFAAAGAAVDWVSGLRRPVPIAVASTLMIVLAGAWAVRSLSVDHVLRRQAFKVRNDWADVPLQFAREERWPADPRAVALIERLRTQALDVPVPNSQLLPEWNNRWFGD